MPLPNRGLIGQSVLPYVDVRSYAGSDVFIDMTFFDHTDTPVVPLGVGWQLDDITDNVSMIAASTFVPTGTTYTLQIPGAEMVMTYDWKGSQLCQLSGQFQAIDSVTNQPFVATFCKIIELCSIQTPNMQG